MKNVSLTGRCRAGCVTMQQPRVPLPAGMAIRWRCGLTGPCELGGATLRESWDGASLADKSSPRNKCRD